MKYKLNEEELNLMEKVRKITLTDYEIDAEGYIEIKMLLDALDSLVYDNKYQQERYEELHNRMELYYELKREWREDY